MSTKSCDLPNYHNNVSFFAIERFNAYVANCLNLLFQNSREWAQFKKVTFFFGGGYTPLNDKQIFRSGLEMPNTVGCIPRMA